MEALTTTNIVTIGVAFSVVTGWFVNGIIQRKFEISKERFKARFNMLKDGLELMNSVRNNESEKIVSYISTVNFQSAFLAVNQNFTIYADDDELMQWQEFSQIIKTRSHKDIIYHTDRLIELLRIKVRKELNL